MYDVVIEVCRVFEGVLVGGVVYVDEFEVVFEFFGLFVVVE